MVVMSRYIPCPLTIRAAATPALGGAGEAVLALRWSKLAGITQLAEWVPCKHPVRGSNPLPGSMLP